MGTSAIKDYIQKNLSKANTYSGYHSGQWKWQHWQGFRFWHCSFHHSIGPFCFSDNPNSLFGPEVVIAQSSTNYAFFAYGYHDIFDKKWFKSCCNFSYMVSLMQVRDIFCWSTHLFLSLGLSLVIIFTLCCWLFVSSMAAIQSWAKLISCLAEVDTEMEVLFLKMKLNLHQHKTSSTSKSYLKTFSPTISCWCRRSIATVSDTQLKKHKKGKLREEKSKEEE